MCAMRCVFPQWQEKQKPLLFLSIRTMLYVVISDFSPFFAIPKWNFYYNHMIIPLALYIACMWIIKLI